MSSLLQTAINAALSGSWQKAIEVNQSLLKENKGDVNSMNRLAHAFVQIGKLDEAKKLYKKILSLDKYNTIATKNLEKLASLPKNIKIGARQKIPTLILPSTFIEESGKTKTVSLINTAPASILSHLHPGEPVFFHPKKHSVEVRNLNKVYLGALPDDFAFKLLRFLRSGYEYSIYIKSATKNSVLIFIRETKRAKRFKSQPSFISTVSIYHKHQSTRSEKITDAVDEEENQRENQDEDEEL